MAHADITPSDQDNYYASDAIDIPFAFTNEHDTSAIDLTGMTVEFRVKESLTDSDANAILTKTGTEGSAPADMTFTDPVNGKVTIHVDTGDTSGFTDDSNGNPQPSAVKKWHVRVIDGSGAQVTSETGDWQIHKA